MQEKINGNLPEPIPVHSGVTQGDFLRPLLINKVVDEVKQNVRERHYNKANWEELRDFYGCFS